MNLLNFLIYLSSSKHPKQSDKKKHIYKVTNVEESTGKIKFMKIYLTNSHVKLQTDFYRNDEIYSFFGQIRMK